MSIDKVVIAILLGDGHVTKAGRIMLSHSITQKDYLLHKVGILGEQGFKMRVSETEQMSYGCIRKFVKAQGYASQGAKHLREILYPNGTKEVPQQYAEAFGFSDWAFMYMDDGRANVLSHTNNMVEGERVRVETDKFVNRYEICTESFTESGNKLLMDNLLQLGVDAYLSKRNRIIISRADSKVKFYEGIEQFIVPSMLYKIAATPTLSYKLQ